MRLPKEEQGGVDPGSVRRGRRSSEAHVSIFDIKDKKMTRNEGPTHCRTRTDINYKFLTENQLDDLLGLPEEANDEVNLEENDSAQ